VEMIGGDVLAAEAVASISRRRGQPEGSRAGGDGSSMSSTVARCDDSTGLDAGKRWVESGELGWLGWP